MTKREWDATIAHIESLRYQIDNSAGVSKEQRIQLRTALVIALTQLADKMQTAAMQDALNRS